MSDVKEHSKLISFTILGVLVSFLLNFYLYIHIEPVDYSVRFHEFVEDSWLEDLQNKILWHFPNWNDNGKWSDAVCSL